MESPACPGGTGAVVRRQGGAKEENIASSSVHNKPRPPGMGAVWA